MRAAALAALLFLATAVLVDVGVFHGFDQYATTHWMPYLRPREHHPVTLRRLLFPGSEGPLGKQLIDVWIYAASVPVSALVVALAGRRARSLAWPVVWVAANAVDVVGKLIVERPALYHDGIHVVGLDHALPSGHTIRAFVVAAAVASMSRPGRLAYAWAASVPFALVAGGHHAPTDCVAGVFVAASLIGVLRSRVAEE